MGEGWMNGVVVTEIGKGLIKKLNHFVTAWSRKKADVAGRS
jgi:hypothetical protein